MRAPSPAAATPLAEAAPATSTEAADGSVVGSPGDGTGSPPLRIANLTRSYGNRVAVDDVSLTVGTGVTGLLGPNGAGKSTLLSCIAGISPWDHGSIEVAGVDLGRHPRRARRSVGYMPERVSFPPEMSVRSYLTYVAAMKGVSRRRRSPDIDRICEHVGLAEVQERVVANLSKGYRQRVGLAQALLADPAVLILDEPTAGLDPMNVLEVRELLREEGRRRAIIVATHHLPEARLLCDRTVVMAVGSVVYDAPPAAIGPSVGPGSATRIVLGGPTMPFAHADAPLAGGVRMVSCHQIDGRWALVVEPTDDGALGRLVRELAVEWDVVAVEPVRDPLEDAFRTAVLSMHAGPDAGP